MDRKDDHFSYSRVFEKYNFTCDIGIYTVQNILGSVNPDVTVFAGAFDANYTWEYPRQDAVSYMAGLTNILAAFSTMKRGRFLYLSSHEVYGEGYMEPIRENKEPSPKGFRATALAQGEEICDNYRKTQGTDTVILRPDHMYWVPEKGEVEDNAGVKQVAGFMKRHSESYLTEDDAGGGLAVKGWHNLRRIFKEVFHKVENLGCFLLVLLLSQWTGGAEFMAKLDLYLQYVLLFGLIYGQQQAVVSGFLAVLGYNIRAGWHERF